MYKWQSQVGIRLKSFAQLLTAVSEASVHVHFCVCRKRVRAADMEEEALQEEEESRVKELEKERRKLMKQVDELTEKLEMEQKRGEVPMLVCSGVTANI